MSALFDVYRRTVPPEWLDYNGHLNEAYYLVAFSHASDCWMDAIGLDAPGRAKHRRTIYTLEAHITYRAEIAGGAALRVVTQILGVDAKRVYAHSAMHVGSDPAACATHEALYICVDTDTRRSAPWPETVRAALDAMAADHAAAGEPATAGLSLGRHRLKA